MSTFVTSPLHASQQTPFHGCYFLPSLLSQYGHFNTTVHQHFYIPSARGPAQGCDSITYAIPPFSHNLSSSSLFYQQPTTPVFPFPPSSCRYSPSPSSLESLQNCLHFLNVHSSLQSQQYDLCPHGPVETSLGQLSKNCLVK